MREDYQEFVVIEKAGVFYTNCSSCFINNGFASEVFKLERGVRQGCPLSGSLFVLCAEILANAIRNDNTIKGIKIHLNYPSMLMIQLPLFQTRNLQ